MKASAAGAAKPAFQKTEVPCLYRYSSNGVYYALLKARGKQKRLSLETTDKAVAKRKLADLQRDQGKVDPSQGRLTLRELAARYLRTIEGQAAATVSLKRAIVARLLKELPAGADASVAKVRPSDLEAWLAGYKMGYSTHNHYVQALKALFTLAVNKALADSPAARLAGKKVVKPIRVTPTFEEFRALITDVRGQKGNAEAQASADFLEFMGLVGVGQAEVTGLQKQHVNLHTMQITFFRHKTRTPYTVPIYPQAEALVRRLLARPSLKPTDPVFPTNLAKSKNPEAEGKSKDAKKSLHAACARLNLPAYTQRSLRRMFITRCIEKQIDVKVIAQWQGHQDGGKLILGTYSHVRNVHAEEIAKKLA